MAPSPPAVLHITSALGGGVDRYIRDVASTVPGRHFIWHVGDGDVVEDVQRAHYWPVRGEDPALPRLLATAVRLVHLHGVDRACRQRLELLQQSAALPFVVTLHDLGFLHPRLFAQQQTPEVDEGWVAEVEQVLQSAAAVIAPSDFIRTAALGVMPRLHVGVVAPGLRPHPVRALPLPEAFAEKAPENVVAAVGAIGPHKGSALLPPIAERLKEHAAVVAVIGYTDRALQRGWAAPGLFVHGPYADADVGSWLAAYAPKLALFPNRLPESFSYTLSEVWAAGVPAIVPDEGALGERVRRHGGGWTLPAGFQPDAAATLITHLLSTDGSAEWDRVKSHVVSADIVRVPTLPAMSAALSAVYARFGVQPDADIAANEDMLPGLQALLATNLNGVALRGELALLCEAADKANAAMEDAVAAASDARADAAATRRWAAKLEEDLGATRTWATKIEADVAALNVEIARRDELIRELTQGVDWLKREMERLAADKDQLAADKDRLAADKDRLALHKAAFDLLPPFARDYLLRKAARAGR